MSFYRRRDAQRASTDKGIGPRACDPWLKSDAADAVDRWWEVHAAVSAFGLTGCYTRADVELAFRRLARKAHPDMGGTHQAFQTLVAQRDLLLNQTAASRLNV